MKSVKLKENQVKLRIFEYILRSGPATLYDITKEFPKVKQANLSRVMKRLIDESSILLVKSEYTPRKKNLFGPTIMGLLNACADDNRFRKNFEDYYSKWIPDQQFRNTVLQLMKDKDLKNPEKTLKILLKYLDYVLDSLNMFDEWKSKLPVELQVFFGEMMMMMDKPEETTKRSEEFYKYIIPFRANAEAFLDRAAKAKKEWEEKKAGLYSTIGSDNELLKEK